MQTLLDALSKIHEAACAAEAPADRIPDIYIIRNGHYLCGLPYMWTSDITRRFGFDSQAQAEALLAQFSKELRDARVVVREEVFSG